MPRNLEKIEETSSPRQRFFSAFWDVSPALSLVEAGNLERRRMENSAPDLKSFQAEVLPEDSQL